METISRSLLTFLLNSLWQISLAAAVAALVCRLMRRGPASHRHAVWVAALAAAVLLPLASLHRTAPTVPAPLYPRELAAAAANSGLQRSAPALPATPSAAPSRTISFTQTVAAVLLGVYLSIVLFQLARLVSASIRTVQIRGRARYTAMPEALERVWMRCQEVFGLTGVELLVSAEVSGPVTAGRAIILPESLLAEPSEDVLTTAVGHEMAHIARRDFTCNALYEVLYLPIGFHPAAWFLRREIERTREMACDELVTLRLMDAGAYARSIMSIASAMMAVPRPGYTLGVFDGDILEERIRRLLERPAGSLKRARLLLAGGLGALALCAIAASTLALTARAQGGAQALMKQAEAAYNRGDFQAAAEQFENAVKVEPANIKAKLLLANTLLRQYTPQPGGDNTLALRVRQQYLDVLALAPANRQAFNELMSLDVHARQFDSARQWALKAIQADPRDTAAYYTIGFLDWSLTYPDYARARLDAGMKPQDPGNIPDARLRQELRARHGAHLEDGFRMLQIALQLDPEYSDAMAYMNLLYRIEAGIADTPEQAADAIAKADAWVTKALAAKRRQANRAQPGAALDVDGPVPAVSAPPPPPPPGGRPGNPAEMPQRIVIQGSLQAAKLLRQTPPVYPPAARQAGVSGTVLVEVVIAKDGTVRSAQGASGPPELVTAAVEAIRQWAWRPTLLNGVPVEVATTVEVNFAHGK